MLYSLSLLLRKRDFKKTFYTNWLERKITWNFIQKPGCWSGLFSVNHTSNLESHSPYQVIQISILYWMQKVISNYRGALWTLRSLFPHLVFVFTCLWKPRKLSLSLYQRMSIKGIQDIFFWTHENQWDKWDSYECTECTSFIFVILLKQLSPIKVFRFI